VDKAKHVIKSFNISSVNGRPDIAILSSTTPVALRTRISLCGRRLGGNIRTRCLTALPMQSRQNPLQIGLVRVAGDADRI